MEVSPPTYSSFVNKNKEKHIWPQRHQSTNKQTPWMYELYLSEAEGRQSTSPTALCYHPSSWRKEGTDPQRISVIQRLYQEEDSSVDRASMWHSGKTEFNAH